MQYNKITLLPADEEELEVSCTNVGKKLTITAKDALANITKVKIALASDASSKEDFLTKGTDIPITVAQTITQEYEVNESGTYNIYIEDELGNTFIYTKTVTDDEINFVVANLDSGKYKVTATSSEGNITKLQVAYSKNENESKDNLDWQDISITSGSSVTTIITKETDSDIYAYIYAESDKSKNKIISFLINANSSDNDTTAPIITLTQDTEDLTKINVNVKDEANNLSSVKYASGEQETSYFASNGNEISVPDSAKEISSSFTISNIGTYTVYAKDSKGNETTEKIVVTKISEEEDTTGPTITTEKEKIDNSTIRIKITTTDDSSSIKVIKIAPNKQDISYFSDNGTTLYQTTDGNSATAYVDAKSNGTYTIYAEDSKGNSSISSITITEIGTSMDGNNTSGGNNTSSENNTANENDNNSSNTNNNSNTNNSNNINNTNNSNNNNSSSSTRNDGTGKTKVQTISADNSSSSSSKTKSLPYTGGIKSILLVLIAIISIFGIVEYRKYRNLK